MHNKKFLHIDGREISYLEQGRGPNVLLLPGLGCDCTLWRHVVPILAQKYHVVSLSLPFYGTYSNQHQQYNFNTYHDFLDRVIKLLGWRDGFYLCGHSLGAIVSIKYSNSHPKKVKKMVLVSAPLSDHKEPIPILWRLAAEFAMNNKKTQQILDWVACNPEIVSSLSQIMFPNRHSNNPRGSGIGFLKTIPIVAAASCYNDLFNMDFTKDVENIRLPVTVVYGLKDNELQKFGGTTLYSHIKNANVVSLDSFHFIPTDLPNELSAKILEFFG